LSAQGLLWARSALSDNDWVVRESAAVVLGDVAGSEAATLLARLAADKDPRVRRSAMRALGRRDEPLAADGGSSTLNALHAGIQDAELAVRLEALRSLARVAQALVRRGATGLAEKLSGWLAATLRDGSPLEQALARVALLRAGDTAQRGKLRQLLQSPSAEARRVALENLEPDRELLASLLADPAAPVRLLAARRLAELGDRRAIPVLNQALAQGGAGARTAQLLLLRLGEKPAPPIAVDGQDPVEQRLQAVDALAGLPAEQAVPLLLAAARDHDLEIKRRVATIAADLREGGQAVLRLLLDDASPSIRALAATLLGRQRDPRSLEEPRPAGVPASPPPPPPPPPSDPAGQPAPPPPPSEPAPTASSDEKAAPAEAPAGGETQAEQLTRSGVKLLQQHEFSRAQKLLEKARHLCAHEKKPGLCGELGFDLSYHLGRAYEAQGYEAEAMAEYERVIKHSGQVSGKKSELAEAQSAVLRLAPHLGVVRITHASGGKCQETTRWMPLGAHTIEVDGKKQEVTVRLDAPARVGSCP
jgi:HEAT repeat protein